MPELCFFKFDHSTDPGVSASQAAQLVRPFDLVDWRPDGWAWGALDLTNPWFRIVSWVDALPADCDALLSPELPTYDDTGNPLTIPQFRGFYVNLADPTFTSQLPTVLAWWDDDTRAAPIFTVPTGFSLTVANVKLARAPISV